MTEPYGFDPDFSTIPNNDWDHPISLGKVQRIFDDLDEAELLEDRREYSVKDLETSYPDLHPIEVRYLYRMIQDVFDPELAVSLDDIPAETFKRYMLDTVFNGLDGWEMSEHPIVQGVINDIKRYYKNGGGD